MHRKMPFWAELSLATCAVFAMGCGASTITNTTGIQNSNTNANRAASGIGTRNGIPVFSMNRDTGVRTIDLVEDGVSQASELGISDDQYECVGHIHPQPSLLIDHATQGQTLTILGLDQSGGDPTLIVRGPNGEWYCSDDDGGGLNPLLEIHRANVGQYQVWLGNLGVDSSLRARIQVQLGARQYHPSNLAVGSAPTLSSIDLRGNFSPSPRGTQMTLREGNILAEDEGLPSDCVGSVSRQPQFVVNYSSPAALLRFYTESQNHDPVMIVRDPEGGWSCSDDDGNGLNPSVLFHNPVAGRYEIWVGTLGSEGAPPFSSGGPTHDTTFFVSEQE